MLVLLSMTAPRQSGSSASAAAAAAAAAASGEPTAVTDAELERVWSSVMHGGDADVPLKRSSSSMLGIRAGDASFEVPELKDYKKGRVLPENGTYTEPDEDPSEGGRYGPQWREETWTRQQILESNPDYQFVVLVAGKTNAPVERLYDDDSLERAFRMRLAESQTRLRAQEVQQSREDLQEALAREQDFQSASIQLQGRVADRRRTDPVLALLPVHTEAVRAYIREQESNIYRLAVGSAMELGATALVSVPVKEDEILDRAIVRLLGGVDSVVDEPDIGTSIQVTSRGLIQFAFSDSVTGTYRIPEVATARNMREALTVAYRAAYPEKIPTFYGGSTDIRDANPTANAPLALRDAVQRLLTFYILSEVNEQTDEREAMLAGFAVGYGTDPTGSTTQLIDSVTRTLLPDARAITRAAALPAWLDELRAFVAVLRTAHNLHDAESPLSAPSSLREDSAPFTVTDIARSAGEEARERAMLAGVSAAAADQAAQVRVREVLANPPNHIFGVPAVARDASRRALEEIERRLTAVDPAAGVQALLDLGVAGSPGLDPDLALMQSIPALQRATFRTATEDDPAWAQAMSWYEQLGGSLFQDRDAWALDEGDRAAGIKSGVEFPASADLRTRTRGTEEIPVWGPEIVPPPLISAQMRALWNSHVPSLKSARRKIAIAAARTATIENSGTVEASSAAAAAAGSLPRELRPDANAPSLTTNEVLVFRTMTGGFDPADSERALTVFPKTQWPLFVFMGRLLETELAFTESALQQTIASRGALLDQIRERIRSILSGVPQTQPVAEPPYQHRRGWVEEPANSGIVSLKPIVVAAIDESWGQIRRQASHIAQGVSNNIEILQHHPDLRGDFAELVAVNMSLYAQRFPTRYVQLGQRVHTRVDQINILNRFIYNTEVTVSSTQFNDAGAGAGAAQAVQVHVRPVSAPVQAPTRTGPLVL